MVVGLRYSKFFMPRAHWSVLQDGLGHVPLCFEHRFDDPGVSPAPAEVSAHAFAHALGIIAGMALFKQADRAHDLAGRAEATLQAVMRDEGGLHRMQLVAVGDAFDGENVSAVVADRQSQARINPAPVDQHGAGAALAAVAALLGAVRCRRSRNRSSSVTLDRRVRRCAAHR